MSGNFLGWKVLLDVGHGFRPKGSELHYDPGCTGPDITEHELAWYIAARVQLGLELLHFGTVGITGAPMSLSKRAARAKDFDVFVSVHLNAYNTATQGTETFIYHQASVESARLGDTIQDSLTSYLDFTDRGCKRAAFGVLRAVPEHVAACLVEPFFLDAMRDRDTALENARIASAALVDGIQQYCARGRENA